jgi:hypothetical protein
MKAMVVVFLLIFAGIIALYLRSFDTQYAPGYTENAFKSVKLGDSEETVKSLLGEPLSSYDSKPYVLWVYSAESQPDFPKAGIASGTHTTVTLERGAVTAISGRRQTSAHSFTYGQGHGFLAMTRQEIDGLKGCSPEQFKQKYGPPRAVYEYKAFRVLRYSRSPSSSNYRLRTIGLDAEGKVVHVWRSIYWD